MSGRYDDYFDGLKEAVGHHYSRGGDLVMTGEELHNKIINDNYYAHLKTNEHDNKKRNLHNNKIGALELLQNTQPQILPIEAYTRRNLVQNNGLIARNKQHNANFHFSSGFGIDPTTKQPTHSNHSIVIDNDNKPHTIKPKPVVPKHAQSSDSLLQKLVDSGLAKVHIPPPKPPPPSNKFNPRVKGELPPEQVYKMSIPERIKYAKNMATIFRDKGMGEYRLPEAPIKLPTAETMYKGKVEVLGIGNTPPNSMLPADKPTNRRPAQPTPTVITATKNPKTICVGDCPS